MESNVTIMDRDNMTVDLVPFGGFVSVYRLFDMFFFLILFFHFSCTSVFVKLNGLESCARHLHFVLICSSELVFKQRGMENWTWEKCVIFALLWSTIALEIVDPSFSN